MEYIYILCSIEGVLPALFFCRCPWQHFALPRWYFQFRCGLVHDLYDTNVSSLHSRTKGGISTYIFPHQKGGQEVVAQRVAGVRICISIHIYLSICICICICAPGSGAFVYLNLCWAQCDHLIWIRVWHTRRLKIKQRMMRVSVKLSII